MPPVLPMPGSGTSPPAVPSRPYTRNLDDTFCSTDANTRPPTSETFSMTASSDSGTSGFQYCGCGLAASANMTRRLGAPQLVRMTIWSPAMSMEIDERSVSAMVTSGPFFSTFLM